MREFEDLKINTRTGYFQIHSFPNFQIAYLITNIAIMKAFKSTLLLVLAILFSAATYKTIEGVNFDDEITVNGEKLVLNGVGLREKYWLDLYVAGMYMKAKTQNASDIINKNETKMLRINVVSNLISSEKFLTATDEGFKNSAGSLQDSIASQIKIFKSIFKDEEIVENDDFKFTNIPGKGVKVEKNGVLKKTISGELFSKALFGIWFCDKPADQDLKDGMLGL